MKRGLLFFGLALLIIGANVLAYQGITYTTREKIVEVEPVKATKKPEKTVPLSPIIGGSGTVAGITLVFTALKRS